MSALGDHKNITDIESLLVWVCLEVMPILPVEQFHPIVTLVKKGESQDCPSMERKGYCQVGTNADGIKLPCIVETKDLVKYAEIDIN